MDVVKVYVIKPVGSGGVRKKDKKKDKKGKTASFVPEEVTKPEVVLIAQRTAHNVSGLLSRWLCIDRGFIIRLWWIPLFSTSMP